MQQRVKTDVFIVRIWREPRETSGEPALWRGAVEHVASRTVRHIDRLSEIIDFIEAATDFAADGSQGAEPRH